MRVLRVVRNLLSDCRGATAIEYGLILALVFLALVSGVAMLGNSTGSMWNDVSNKVSSAH